MAVLIILFASLLVYRSAGALGVEWLDSWQTAARCALSTMLFFTASAHFTRMREDLVRMMPPSIPWPRALVFFTGLCEIRWCCWFAALPDKTRRWIRAHPILHRRVPGERPRRPLEPHSPWEIRHCALAPRPHAAPLHIPRLVGLPLTWCALVVVSPDNACRLIRHRACRNAILGIESRLVPILVL